MFAMRCYAFHNRSRSKDVQEKVEIFQYMEREKKRIADTRVQSYGMVNIAFSFYFQVCCILILTTTTARSTKILALWKHVWTERQHCVVNVRNIFVRPSASQSVRQPIPNPVQPSQSVCYVLYIFAAKEKNPWNTFCGLQQAQQTYIQQASQPASQSVGCLSLSPFVCPSIRPSHYRLHRNASLGALTIWYFSMFFFSFYNALSHLRGHIFPYPPVIVVLLFNYTLRFPLFRFW